MYDRNNRSSSSSPQKQLPEIALTHSLNDYTGIYIHLAYGRIEVINKNDSLHATYNGKPILFRHFNYDIFRAGVPGSRFQFQMNKEGKIVSISGTLEPEVGDIVFIRQ